MDDKTIFFCRVANMAGAKGIWVVNSAENDGGDKWHIIGAPADADSVLSIGGVEPSSGYHVSFSSFGPTEDDRMKPNVSALGIAAVAGASGLKQKAGTSFSSPLVAGFAACAWQSNPDLTNMELFRELEKSGHLYPYFDYAHGFGIPQASYFVDQAKTMEPSFEITNSDGFIKVKISSESFRPGQRKAYETEGAEKYYPPMQDFLFYHVQLPIGRLDEYFVLKVTQRDVLKINPDKFEKGTIIRVFYKGYMEEYTVE